MTRRPSVGQGDPCPRPPWVTDGCPRGAGREETDDRAKHGFIRPTSVRKRLAAAISARDASSASMGFDALPTPTKEPLPRRLLKETVPLNLRDKATKIAAAAKIHKWMHTPVPDGPSHWTCSKCGIGGANICRFISSSASRGSCGGVEMPDVPTRRSILCSLHLQPRVNVVELHQARLGYEVEPTTTAAFDWVCPDCGWQLHVRMRTPWRQVHAHARAHGHPPQRLAPRHTQSETFKKAQLHRIALKRDMLQEEWLKVRPPFAHCMTDDSKTMRMPNGKPRTMRRCGACDVYFPTSEASTRPCWAAAGFRSARDTAFWQARPRMTAELRRRWRDVLQSVTALVRQRTRMRKNIRYAAIAC